MEMVTNEHRVDVLFSSFLWIAFIVIGMFVASMMLLAHVGGPIKTEEKKDQ